MTNQNNQESTSFNDQADGKFDQVIDKKRKLLTKGVVDDTDVENEKSLTAPRTNVDDWDEKIDFSNDGEYH